MFCSDVTPNTSLGRPRSRSCALPHARATAPIRAARSMRTRMSALPAHVRTREMKYNAPPAKITTGVQAAAAGGSSACSPNC
jgi:hypothetical protein